MSTDVVADALLGLATCESSIKSLSRILTSLHSIDALHRLKEKADVVEALLVIASFASFLAPPPVSAPLKTVGDDRSSVSASLEGFERRTETSTRDQLAVAEGRQDDTTAFTRTPILPHPPMLEDGRDGDDDVPPSSQSALSHLSPAPLPRRHFIHPVRKSEMMPFAPEEKPLYSFLIHFPVYCALGAVLSVTDRADLFSLPVMQKWGFGGAMTDCAYPRLRLTNRGAACIVMDDDLGRLEAIRKDFQKAGKELLDKSAGDDAVLDRKFFLVGTWSEQHVTLVFSALCVVWDRESLARGFKRWITTPGALWKDILDIHPILLRYQEMSHGQEGGSSLLGAGLFYQKQRYVSGHQNGNTHRLTLVVPFLGCPHAHLFAHDFVAQHSNVSFVLDGKNYGVGVQVVKMRPPSLKEDRNWDGPVLRHDPWLDGIDSKFRM